ncbi:metallophosphoesterase [Clostridium sp. DL1XJH146]
MKQEKKKFNGKILICILVILLIVSIILGYRIYNNYERESVAKIQGEDFKIIVATDLHYLTERLNDNGSLFQEVINNADGKETQFSSEILDAFINETLDTKPDMVILTGDLTFNGEKLSHEDLSERLTELTEVGIRVLVLPGNHDTNNIYASKYFGDSYERVETVNTKEFGEIYNDYGLSEAISVDDASNSFVYQLEDKVWLISLDTNTDKNENVVLGKTLNWLEKVLKDAEQQGVKVISFTHQTFFLHNDAFSNGYRISNAEKLAELYQDYGVNINFSGHMHIQHIITEEDTTEFITSSISVWPYQYGVISYEDGKMSYNTKKIDMQNWVKENSITDKNLIEFSLQGSEFFDSITYKKAYTSLDEYDISEEEKEEMLEYFVRLNREYFSGRLDKEVDIDSSKAKKLWEEKAGDSFMYYYIKSIENEEYVDYTTFELEW